jgi:hypothetical protein
VNAFGAAMVAGDLEAVAGLLHPDVTFASPAVYRPYLGRDATLRVLAAAAQTFEDFEYVGAYGGELVDVLRFRARVGRFELEGVDILTRNEDGQIVDITVMIRPFHAREALTGAMQQALTAS